MKNRDLYKIYEDLKALNDAAGARLSFVIGKNLKLIKDELQLIEASFTMSDEYKEFQKKRISLCTAYSNKNEDESPVMIDNRFDIIDAKEFSKFFNILKEEYKEVIKINISKEEDYENLLNEECTLELVNIKLDLIPDICERKDETDGLIYKRPIGPLLTDLNFLIIE